MIHSLTARIRTFDSFRIHDFRWLWASALTSFMAMNMEWITRGWLVLRVANDSPLALALVMASFALPMTFVSLIGGALADRIPRKRLIVFAQGGNAAIILVIGILDMTNTITFWHILVSGTINGSMMAFNMPSRQAIVSEIVPESKLMSSIAMVNSAMNMTRIIGPAIAGFLIIFIGTHGVLFMIATIYGLALLCTLPINAGRKPSSISNKSLTGDIGAGLKYAAKTPPLLGLIIMAFIPVLFGMSYFTLMPAWARETLNVQSDNLGILYMAGGIGALIGSLVVASLGEFKRRGMVQLVSSVVWGIGLAAFSHTSNYMILLPLLVLVGLVGSMFMSLNMTLMQLYSSNEMRGRVMSIAMMTFGAMPLSAIPFGAIADLWIGTADALLLSGVLLVLFTIAFGFLYPSFRRIE